MGFIFLRFCRECSTDGPLQSRVFREPPGCAHFGPLPLRPAASCAELASHDTVSLIRNCSAEVENYATRAFSPVWPGQTPLPLPLPRPRPRVANHDTVSFSHPASPNSAATFETRSRASIWVAAVGPSRFADAWHGGLCLQRHSVTFKVFPGVSITGRCHLDCATRRSRGLPMG